MSIRLAILFPTEIYGIGLQVASTGTGYLLLQTWVKPYTSYKPSGGPVQTEGNSLEIAEPQATMNHGNCCAKQ